MILRCASGRDAARMLLRLIDESRTVAIVAGKYELYKESAGGFRFRLKAGNGEVIATSESYVSKASAQNGIESVKTNADSPTVDLT